MGNMNWHAVLSAAKSIAAALVTFGVCAIVIFGQGSQVQRRLRAYKKSGRFLDFLKVFSRY